MVITNISDTCLVWNYVCYGMDFKNQFLLKDMRASYGPHTDIGGYL